MASRDSLVHRSPGQQRSSLTRRRHAIFYCVIVFQGDARCPRPLLSEPQRPKTPALPTREQDRRGRNNTWRPSSAKRASRDPFLSGAPRAAPDVGAGTSSIPTNQETVHAPLLQLTEEVSNLSQVSVEALVRGIHGGSRMAGRVLTKKTTRKMYQEKETPFH